MTVTELLKKWPDYAEANPFNDAQSELQTVNKIRHFLHFASASVPVKQPFSLAALVHDHAVALIEDMLDGDYPDNHVLLGEILMGNKVVQIQLKATQDEKQFLDEVGSVIMIDADTKLNPV